MPKNGVEIWICPKCGSDQVHEGLDPQQEVFWFCADCGEEWSEWDQ